MVNRENFKYRKLTDSSENDNDVEMEVTDAKRKPNAEQLAKGRMRDLRAKKWVNAKKK